MGNLKIASYEFKAINAGYKATCKAHGKPKDGASYECIAINSTCKATFKTHGKLNSHTINSWHFMSSKL